MKSETLDLPVRKDGVRGDRLADLHAGLASAMVALPVAIGAGILATAPFGAEFAGLGVGSGLVCTILAAAISAALGSSPFSIAGPSSTTSILTAGCLVHLFEASGPPVAGDLFAAMAVLVALSGALLVAAGRLRLGGFIKFIPRPVLAGFSNGIALLLFLSQAGALLGLPGRFGWSWEILHDAKVAAVCVAAATVAACVTAGRLKLRLPPQLAGLVCGFALHYLLAFVFGRTALGPVVGALPDLWRTPEWLSGVGSLAGLPWVQIFAAAFLVAVIGAVQTLMTAASIDALATTRHDANRELVAMGVGNLAAALAGGVASSANLSRASANFRAGARTRRSGLFNALAVLGLVLGGSQLIAAIPLAVMAGLLTHSAWSMVDGWSVEQFRRWANRHERGEVRENIVVIAVMTIGMLWMNPVVAVAVGVVLTMALFLRRMSRTFVRRSYSCEATRSLKMRRSEWEQYLLAEGRRIHVIELEGAVFFGTSDRLRNLVESHHRDALFVILDCRHVRSWDATGVQMLGLLHRLLAGEGRRLLVSHVLGHRRAEQTLRAYGLFEALPGEHLFPDTDRALEFAEDILLATAPLPAPDAMQRSGLDDTALMKGLSRTERETLSAYFDTVEVAAGEELFRIGDAGDRLFVLLEGEVTLAIPIDGHAQMRRLQTLSPGVVFGEMALIDGQPRSASARVDRRAVLKALSRRDFERLRRESPALFAALLNNVALEMSLRLRMANQRLRALEQ